MLLENVFPPIPSVLIMPLAGFVARKGNVSFWGAVAAGSLGSLAGAVFWYIVGRALGGERLRNWVERHGRWLSLSCESLDHAEDWFRRRGAASVFLGRLAPGVRTFISIPAGVYRMPVWAGCPNARVRL
jgi:membrane protein DedA with SNARE-associated domain